MKTEVRVAFYLKKNAVMVRLEVGASRAVFSAKITVPDGLWSGGRARGKSAKAMSVNKKLDEMRASALRHYNELSHARTRVSADEIKAKMLGMAAGQETLLAYFQAHNERFEQRVGVNRSAATAASYRCALGHVTNFLVAKYHLSDTSFSALNRSFIDRYDLYLRVDCGLSAGTIVLQMVRLRTIIKYAIADGIITADPFSGYEPERPNRKPKFLTDRELHRLVAVANLPKKLELIRDLFIFSCYTGIPYSDMCALTEANISTAEDGTIWIKSFRQKTGRTFEIPLLEIPLQIIEKYRGVSGRLLPMYSNSTMNAAMREIAAKCGLNRHLTWHCARHTFATFAISHGVPIESVSKMLGHSRITTTQIYAHVTDKKIDEDMRILEDKINDKFNYETA